MISFACYVATSAASFQSCRKRRLDLLARRRIGALAGAGNRRSRHGKAQPAFELASRRRWRLGAERVVAIHRRQKRRHEAVAGADGVDDLDMWRRNHDTFVAEQSEGAALAKRCDTKSWARLRPGGEALLKPAAWVEPFEILFARLDDVSVGNVAFDQRPDRLAVRGDERAEGGIETGRRPRRGQAHRRDHRLSAALDGGEGSVV